MVRYLLVRVSLSRLTDIDRSELTRKTLNPGCLARAPWQEACTPQILKARFRNTGWDTCILLSLCKVPALLSLSFLDLISPRHLPDSAVHLLTTRPFLFGTIR